MSLPKYVVMDIPICKRILWRNSHFPSKQKKILKNVVELIREENKLKSIILPVF